MRWTQNELFPALSSHTTARHSTDTEDLCFYQLWFLQLKKYSASGTVTKSILYFFWCVYKAFFLFLKVYICTAPFHKTYLQSEIETRDLFMADSHSSVPLDAHELSKVSIRLLWLFREKKKKLSRILSRVLEYRSSHKTTFHPQRPAASCQIST